MSDATEDFGAAKERVLAEFAIKGFGNHTLSFKQAMELREYAKARAHLHSENLTMEEAIWQSLYEGLTEELRKSSPESLAEIESLEKRRDNLQDLQKTIAAKMNARPHDFGIGAWWAFIIIGLLVGWTRSSDVWSTLLCGLVFWIAGMFFCIFAIDSAGVQSTTAIFLHHRLCEKRISAWLMHRALTIR